MNGSSQIETRLKLTSHGDGALEQAQIFSLRLIGGETFMEPN